MARVPAANAAAAAPRCRPLTLQPLHVLALFSLLLLAIHHSAQPRFAPNRPVLLTFAHGASADHIHLLLESLLLSRHAKLTLVLPTAPVRAASAQSRHARVPLVHRFWDLAVMNQFTHAAYYRPHACRRASTTLYILRSHSGPIEPSDPLIRAACLYSGQTVQHQTERPCAHQVLTKATVLKRYLNVSERGDHSLIHELRNLRGGCVIVDGHSFPYSGDTAHEYLHSALHYVESLPYIKQMMSQWRKSRMTVLHLTYDERVCNSNNPRLCITTSISTNHNDTVAYVLPRDFVTAVAHLMRSENSSHVYIAASADTPPSILSALDYSFSRHANVLPRVSGLDETMEHFLERDLAVYSHLFVGDFASPWSSTVYYKRRTMGKVSQWGCNLMHKCKDGAYFRHNERLNKPEWFEKEHGFFSELGKNHALRT